MDYCDTEELFMKDERGFGTWRCESDSLNSAGKQAGVVVGGVTSLGRPTPRKLAVVYD